MNYPANERLYKQYVLNFDVMRYSSRVLLDKSLLRFKVSEYNPPFANSNANAIVTGTVPYFFVKGKKRLIRTVPARLAF